MQNEATIIVGSLDDSQIKKSIQELVQAVADGTQKMKQNFDTTIDGMLQKVRQLNNVKIDAGSANANTQQIVQQERLTQAVKTTTQTFDALANAQQNAMRPKSAQDSFYVFVQSYRDNLSKLKAEITSMPGISLDRQFAEYQRFERQIIEVQNRIQELRAQLNTLYSNPDRSRMEVKAITDEIDRLQAKIKQITSEQLQSTSRIAQEEKAALAAKQAEYDKQRQALRELTVEQRSATEASAAQTSQEQRKTEEIRRQAQAIRESTSWKEKGVGYYSTWVTEDDVRKLASMPIYAKSTLSVEEQILKIEQQLAAERQKRERASQIEQQNTQAEASAAQQRLVIEQQITQEHQKRNKYISPNTEIGNQGAFNNMLANKLGISREEVINSRMYSDSLEKITSEYKQLESAYKKMTATERQSPLGKHTIDRMQYLQQAIHMTKSEMSRPINMSFIESLPVRTLDEMAYKLKQLQAYKRGINVTDPKQAGEIKKVDDAIVKLTRDMDRFTASTKQANEVTNALTRSWNYMKNRMAFYLTIGASTQFVKGLIEIRGQYEMTERALGILVDSAERGSEIFQELSQMALISPYTLIELSQAAKQLTAYDVAAKDVVDTTRRLADMASAVGVPIDRLTYALGQVKAYGYLNARDARMFANAGIPLVRELANTYSELEGKVVSVADVYDRIKKKAISYNDVMTVVTRLTDEGGKYFNFQAKMADTLKVRLANLTLAWNNMLNEIGKESQGMLTTGINALKTLFLHWREFDRALKNVAWAAGIVVAFRALNVILVKSGLQWRILSKEMTTAGIAGSWASKRISMVGKSIGALVRTPLTWWSLLALAIVDVVQAISNCDEATKQLNQSIREGAKSNYDDLAKFSERYQDVANSLYRTEKRQSGTKNGKPVYTDTLIPQDINEDEANKAWEAMREQIELTSKAADEHISRLMQIENVSERLRQGFKIINEISVVSAALKEIDDETIKVTQDWSKWWNLWAAPDGLIGNLKDYQGELNKVIKQYGSVNALLEKSTVLQKDGTRTLAANVANSYKNDVRGLSEAFYKVREDVVETTQSIIDFINMKGWGGNTDRITEVFSQITSKLVAENQLDPQHAFTLQMLVEEQKTKAMQEAYKIRIADEKAALAHARDENARADIQSRIDTLAEEQKFFNSNTAESRVRWANFTKWMKEQHMSDMTEMFRGMDANQIKSLDFQKGEYYKWVSDLARQYAKQNGESYESVFNQLRNYILNANQWSIFIPLTIGTGEEKRVIDILNEADSQVQKATSNIERLKRRRDELAKAGGLKGDYKTAKEYAQVIKEIEDNEKDLARAEAQGGHDKKQETKDRKDEAKSRRDAAKQQRQEESELQKALREELSLIDKVRSTYKKLVKEGVDSETAIQESIDGYDKSVSSINKTFQKFGLGELQLKKFAGVANPREIMNMLQTQLDSLVASGKAKPAEIKDLEVKIKEIKIDAISYDHKKITEGLNNELSKLKDEYELAVELDANPELGDVFADLFDIDLEALPHTFGEALHRANEIAKKELAKLGVNTPFDLMRTDLSGDTWMGIDTQSEPMQKLIQWQKSFRDMFKKNIEDTEKMLDDYVKKYGDYTDKIAEIEADRLEKVKKLNEAYYTEEMRKRPEYIAKLNAIESGAQREKGAAKFDEFKQSRLYIAMFENLDTLSQSTLMAIRQRLIELKDEMGTLSPEQLKQVTQQFEKINAELIDRNPFKGLIKNVRDYARAVGKQGKQAQKDFVQAQRNYDEQEKIVETKKVQLEQLKAQQPWNVVLRVALEGQVKLEEEKLQKLKDELAAAEELNEKYDLMRKIFDDQASEIAKVVQIVATNLQSLGELRDTLHDMFGVELGNELNAIIDDLGTMGEGLNQTVSSLQSGNVVGAVTGVLKTVGGLGDAIASAFGDGAARTKRINKEITKSQEEVRRLQMAYNDLERSVDKAMGNEELRARKLAIANKQAELAEIERQTRLERSKRSKDRDDETIKQNEETMQSLKNEIEDLTESITTTLLGSDIKSAAEDFVSTWVGAWRSGEDTMDALSSKFDDMIDQMIMKSVASRLVAKRLQPIWDLVEQITGEDSAGGTDITESELMRIRQLIGDKSISEAINEDLRNLYNALGVAYGSSSTTQSNLSALQQGIQGITEDQAGALEAYWNANTQQQYVHTDLLTQIRDAVVAADNDAQLGTQAQILLQLQYSYQVQTAIQNILIGWSSANGLAVRCEMV